MSLAIRLAVSVLVFPLTFIVFFIRTIVGDVITCLYSGFLVAAMVTAFWVLLTPIAAFVTAIFAIGNWLNWVDTGEF